MHPNYSFTFTPHYISLSSLPLPFSSLYTPIPPLTPSLLLHPQTTPHTLPPHPQTTPHTLPPSTSPDHPSHPPSTSQDHPSHPPSLHTPRPSLTLSLPPHLQTTPHTRHSSCPPLWLSCQGRWTSSQRQSAQVSCGPEQCKHTQNLAQCAAQHKQSLNMYVGGTSNPPHTTKGRLSSLSPVASHLHRPWLRESGAGKWLQAAPLETWTSSLERTCLSLSAALHRWVWDLWKEQAQEREERLELLY